MDGNFSLYLFACHFRGIVDTIFLTTNPNGSCSEWLYFSITFKDHMNIVGNGKMLPACCSSFFILLNFSISGDRGTLELRKSVDYGKTFKTIGSRIYSFGLGGRFVFASIMTDSVSSHDVLCIILFQNQVCCLLRLHLRK